MLKVRAEELRQRILYWGRELSTWNIPWETGIYPGEMAAFLGMCDSHGVQSIIESGRGEHAYSTQILGEYAERTGTSVVSIDLELNPERGKHCRQLLSRYRQVRCLVGDAFALLPEAAAGLPGPIALLLDGPKETAANRFSLIASQVFPITVIGHHNCDPGLSWSDEFARFFPGALHYENLGLDQLPEWRQFKEWERVAVNNYELPGCPGRSLSQSSIMLASVPPGPRPVLQTFALGGLASAVNGLLLRMRWAVGGARVARARA